MGTKVVTVTQPNPAGAYVESLTPAIAASTGSPDAGSIPLTGADGKLDSSLLNASLNSPAAPTVTVADVSGSYIDLNITPPPTPGWAADIVSYVRSYVVQYTGNGITQLQTIAASATVRLDQLIAGVSYSIEVLAVDYLGQMGAFSASIAVQTTPNTVPPARPVITVTSLSPNPGVLITVTGFNTEPDFAGYQLFRDTNSNLENEPSLLAAANFSGVSFEDVAYSVGGSYWFFLRASNYSGLHTDSVVIGPIAVVAQPSQAPAQLSMATATATANADGSVTFNFPASSDPNREHYNVYRQWVGGLTGWVLIDSPATNTWTDDTARNGLTYQYAATVVNPYGESALDTVHAVQVTARDTLPPQAPSGNFTYLGKVGTIQVSWPASASTTTVAYLIHWRYRQTGQYSEFEAAEMVPGTTFTIEGLQDPSTGFPPTRDSLTGQFEIEIATVDVNGNVSAYVARRDGNGLRQPITAAELVSYQPASPNLPSPPTQLTATTNPNSSISLAWQNPGDASVAGFLIEELYTGASGWETLQPISGPVPGTNRYTATGLQPFNFSKPGMQYRFRVRTIDTSGNLSAANLCDDSDFSSPFGTVWTAQGSPTITSTAGYNSVGYAVRTDSLQALSQTIPVVGGLSYTLSGYYKQDSDPNALAALQIEWSGPGHTQTVNSLTPPVTGAWQRLTLSAVAPAWATSAIITIQVGVGTTSTVLWSAIQFEQSASASFYSNAMTGWLSAVDTQGPTAYSGSALSFAVTPDFGCFHLKWLNGTTADYVNSTYEIWRQQTASTEPGFAPDANFVRISAEGGSDDGKQNVWTDNTPGVNNKVSAYFAIRARDQYGNPQTNGDGSPAFLGVAGASAGNVATDIVYSNGVPKIATSPSVGPAISLDADDAAIASQQSLSSAVGFVGKWWNAAYPAEGGDLPVQPNATTNDPTINYALAGYTFAGALGAPPGINTTTVYARWTGSIVVSATGTYTFGVNADDGANLYVNGQPLVTQLSRGGGAGADRTYSMSGTISLLAGQTVSIVLEYRQGSGPGGIQLLMTPPGGSIGLVQAGQGYTQATLIVGKLVASQIDATNLQVEAANITGTLQASQIDLTSVTSSVAASVTESVNITLQNPNFAAGNTGWALQGAWSIIANNSNYSNAFGGSGYLAQWYSPTTFTSAIVNNQFFPVQPGDVVKASCQAWGANGATSAYTAIRITFYGPEDAFISQVGGNGVTANQTWQTSSAIGIAPAGATSCNIDYAVTSATGYWCVANFQATVTLQLSAIPGQITGTQITAEAITTPLVNTNAIDASMINTTNLTVHGAETVTGTIFANQIEFSDGTVLQSAQPAEAGADKTINHILTKVATSNVSASFTASDLVPTGVSVTINASGPSDVFNVFGSVYYHLATAPGYQNTLVGGFATALVDGNINSQFGIGYAAIASGSGYWTPISYLGSVTGLAAGSHTITLYASAANLPYQVYTPTPFYDASGNDYLVVDAATMTVQQYS